MIGGQGLSFGNEFEFKVIETEAEGYECCMALVK